jgi:hypothetical protein
MASRFRNEQTVIPPIRIRVSREGLATTIDWSAKGADQRLTGLRMALGTVGDPRLSGPLPTDRYLIAGTRRDFGGGDVAAMTSPGLNGFKAFLLATRERQVRSDVFKAKCQLASVGLVRHWLG